MVKIGWVMLAPSMLVLLPVYSAAENTVAIIYPSVMAVQMVFLLYPIVKTERALKSKFGDDGICK